jgi:hypothetical protein
LFSGGKGRAKQSKIQAQLNSGENWGLTTDYTDLHGLFVSMDQYKNGILPRITRIHTNECILFVHIRVIRGYTLKHSYRPVAAAHLHVTALGCLAYEFLDTVGKAEQEITG